jgi:hypothetical protein
MLGTWIAFGAVSAALSQENLLSPRPSPLRFAVTVVAALAIGAALAGVVSAVLWSGTDDLAGFRPLPLFAFSAFGVIAGTLTFLVLSFRADTSFPTRVKTCASCGSAVLENWRLCPDCGRFIEPGDETSGASRPEGPSTVRDSVLPN